MFIQTKPKGKSVYLSSPTTDGFYIYGEKGGYEHRWSTLMASEGVNMGSIVNVEMLAKAEG